MNSVELVEELDLTLKTAGWQGHLKPAMQKLREASERVLLAPGNIKTLGDKQKSTFTDDYIKGRISVLDWMLAWDERLVALATELEQANTPPQEDPEPVGNFYAPDNPSA